MRRDGRRTSRCFIGGGAYEHHIPDRRSGISPRVVSFTVPIRPTRRKPAQGTLQTIYEYQTMMTEPDRRWTSVMRLCMTALQFSRRSGALMSVRANRANRSPVSVLLAAGRESPVSTRKSLMRQSPASQGLITFDFMACARHVRPARLDFRRLWTTRTTHPVAVVVQQPVIPAAHV